MSRHTAIRQSLPNFARRHRHTIHALVRAVRRLQLPRPRRTRLHAIGTALKMPVEIQPKNIHNGSQANPINAAIFPLQTPVLQQPEPQTHNARPWLKLQQFLPNRLQQSQPLHGFAAVALSLAFG